MKIRRWPVLLFFLCVPLLSGCAKQEIPRASEVGFYLDTVITLTAYTEDRQALKDALQECGRLEQILSRTVEGSDVWRVNHAEGEPVAVSDETAAVLRKAHEISQRTNGAFDVTVAPASVLWDFTSEGEKKLPDPEALREAAALIDYRQLKLEGNTVTLPMGMMIDLGAIAKGYIADRIAEYLQERGVRNATLSFGGNIVCIGQKPDGTDWKIGIQDIDRPTGEYMLVASCAEGSVVTSGIYERGFDLNGIRYHHLLSTEDGMPVQNELASVTVFAARSMEGDALSTAAFVLGTEKGLELIESMDGVEAVFIARDRSVTCSSGAKALIQEP